MSRYDKITLWGAIIYSLVVIGSIAFKTYETGYFIPGFLTLIFQSLVLSMFYLGFKKKKRLFASLAIGWLTVISIDAISKLRILFPNFGENDTNYFMIGFLIGFVGTIGWALITYKAAIDIIRSSHQSNKISSR
jgi:hypothetical protein